MNNFLEVRDLQVTRQGNQILSVSHLELGAGELLAVIGPNGAGKSTLLLALGRLIPIERGEILLNGQPAGHGDNLAFRRRLGLVLQEPLLLDMTVFENVAVGLQYRGLPKAEIRSRVAAWMERLGIQHLSERKAHHLSGGEAQRVSLARAFVLEPDLLLLDEPFSALDAPSRQRLVDELQAILQQTHTTTIFITHDLDEALRLGQRVAVVIGGQIRQVDKPQEVFYAPADPDVAAFVGVEIIIPAIAKSVLDGLLIAQTTSGTEIEAVGDAQPGQALFVCLRPEDITLWAAGSLPLSSARNVLRGVVKRIIPQGVLLRIVVDCSFPVTALITRFSAQQLGLVEGMAVSASFKASAAHVLKR